MAHNSSFDSQGSIPSWKVTRSSSDLGSFSGIAERVVFKPRKSTSDLVQGGGIEDWNLSRSSSARWTNEPSHELLPKNPNIPESNNIVPAAKPRKKSASDLVLRSYSSLSGSNMKLETVESLPFPPVDISNRLLKSNVDDSNIIQDAKEGNSVSGSVTKEYQSEPNYRPSSTTKSTLKPPRKSLSTGRKTNFENYPLPQSAASYYSVNSSLMEISEMCESIRQLNEFLRARKSDLKAGVPGMFLHAVLGQEVADVSSIVSTIMYAFHLNETLKSSELCTVPILNMKRAELNMHAELQWLLDSSFIDQSSLVFVDEIDLSYYDLFGSLKLVLLNGHNIPTKQEALKESLVEIFNCKQANSFYPWVETVTVREDCSFCTLVAEKFAVTSSEMLAGRGFCRLLLAGILLDTGNLTNAQCTSKDKYMTTALIKGAGRFGSNGLYQILKYKMFDVSGLKVRDILKKDFKKWTRVAGKPDIAGTRLTVSHIGMSSIGISLCELLSHEASATEEIILYQQSEKLRLLVIVSGYYDAQKIFKREILVAADTPEHMRNFLNFINANASQLPLKVINQPGLKEELRAFEIDNKVTSRKTIERMLEEYGGTSNSRRG